MMTFFVVSTLILCGVGVTWLLVDINRTYKQIERAFMEQCQSEDEE